MAANYNCQAIRQVLDTHNNLIINDIIWASDVICRQKYNTERLAQILTHLNKRTYIGRLSWVVNYRVEKDIIDRNEDKLIKSLEILWPEFEVKLSDRDHQRLRQLRFSEITATLLVLESDECLSGNCQALLFPCRSNSYESYSISTNSSEDHQSVFQKCLEEICLYEQHESGNKNVILSSSTLFPNQSYVMDDITNPDRRTCYSHDQIMVMMSNNNSNIPGFLRMRFGVDHSIYKKAQEIISQ